MLALGNTSLGNCLFLSLSQQLAGARTPSELREDAVAFMRQHADDFMPQLISLSWDMVTAGELPPCTSDLPVDQIVEVVLEALARPGTWGGAECIAALARHTRREIRVYQENGPTIVFHHGRPGPTDEAPLRIVHRFGHRAASQRTHYESVLEWRPSAPTPQRVTFATQAVSTTTELVSRAVRNV